MKHLSFAKLIAFLMASAALFGCREKENFVLVDRAIFQGSIETETKTAVDGLNVVWSDGDSISVFYRTTANMRYNLNSGAGSTSATFIYGTSVFTGGTMELARNYAVFPYNSQTMLNGDGTINYTFPTTQSYAEGSFA